MNSRLSIEWRCRHCGWGRVENRDQILARLRANGMLTRDVPSDATLLELARAARGRLKCSDCGAVGLAFEFAPDDAAASWGDPIPCEACDALIPAARLEVFPDSRLCTKCQAKLDRGESIGPTEYCLRCGAPMILRPTRGAGITRYQAVCSQGPQCGH